MFKHNSFWQFLASVKLALVTIFFITVTSIIGTVIPQNNSNGWYEKQFGEQTAQFFDILNITDMYNSWWFISLLILLCINLIICSIDRFPTAWKQIKLDGLSFKKERLEKMRFKTTWQNGSKRKAVENKISKSLLAHGWKYTRKIDSSSTIFFSQKGSWSRTGVYLVHTSILIIFLGAAIGYFAGFKGSITIPETMERDGVVLFKQRTLQKLGFSVRCNSFAIEFYSNGMPKEYTSSLTVLENGAEILTKEIEVNKPLKYKGITFYQSSYEPYQKFLVTIENSKTGNKKTFITSFQKQTAWPDENLHFGIINAKSTGQSIVSSKIWFKDDSSTVLTKWADNNESIVFAAANADYRISAKQLYATGLQVSKDPGVLWVYFGFALMLLGLYGAFFMSHRRIWLLLTDTDNGIEVSCFGSANKNQAGFERSFCEITARLQD